MKRPSDRDELIAKTRAAIERAYSDNLDIAADWTARIDSKSNGWLKAFVDENERLAKEHVSAADAGHHVPIMFPAE